MPVPTPGPLCDTTCRMVFDVYQATAFDARLAVAGAFFALGLALVLLAGLLGSQVLGRR